jgi:hypothetical protein
MDAGTVEPRGAVLANAAVMWETEGSEAVGGEPGISSWYLGVGYSE